MSIVVRPAIAQPTIVTLDEVLPASDRLAGDGFGQSVAASGDVIVVGAPEDEINFVDAAGSAYVYRRSGGQWVEEQIFRDSDRASFERFGFSVAVSGDVIVVGEPGNRTDTGLSDGAAYVYRFNGSQWIEEQKLTSSDGAGTSQFFGFAVDVSGDVIVVGARDDNNDNGLFAGAAYVYRFDGAQWVEEQKIIASERSGDERGERFGDMFGSAVSVSGNVIIVGAFADDEFGPSSGRAHVYRWNGAQWIEEQRLLPPDGAAGMGFGFGFSVDVAPGGHLFVVGAQQDDENGDLAGAAYVYLFNGAEWVVEQKLLAFDGASGDLFGSSVSVGTDGDLIVVGAYRDDGNTGSAYVFRLDGGQWLEEQKLRGSTPGRFGRAVAASSRVIVIGAPAANLDSGLAYVGVLEGAADTDGDGLSDDDENAIGTDPNDPDTDDDGLLDGTEVELANANNSNLPDPLNPDSDGDGLLDGEEVLVTGTDPSNPDTDGDGLPDNIDPNPLDPGESDDELELATRSVCDGIRQLDLALFNGPNDNANSGRRNSLATRCAHAANRVGDGKYEAAVSLLLTVLAKVDGDPVEPDWIFAGAAQASLADGLSEVIALLLR